MNGNAPTLNQILAAHHQQHHATQPRGWGQPRGAFAPAQQVFPAAPVASRSRLLGFAVGGLVLAAGLWWLANREGGKAEPVAAPAPTNNASLLDAPVPTPYIAMGGRCPRPSTVQPGGRRVSSIDISPPTSTS